MPDIHKATGKYFPDDRPIIFLKPGQQAALPKLNTIAQPCFTQESQLNLNRNVIQILNYRRFIRTKKPRLETGPECLPVW
ncbi:MAG: hypothetical protein DI535_01465 [Citrobacter freundii]|nr:MAG: hypothetical protein DI535_01465 [Citrobacter freundii]